MKTKPAADKAHAKYSPSSLYRVFACAGSVNLSAKAPPSRSNPAAEEGTRAHELMELMLKKEPYAKSSYPSDMFMLVNIFVNKIENLLSKDSELLVETKIKLHHIHPELEGTADVSIVNEFDTLHVIDYKHGRGFVSEKDNPQTLTYLLGIAHKYNYNFADYKTSIYQPRYAGVIFRTDGVDFKRLRKFEEKLKRGIEAAEDPNAELSAGNHCHFCPAKSICPELNKKAMAEAMLDFDNETQPDPVELNLDQIKTLLDKAYYLKLWIAEVEAYAHERLSSGKKIEGYSLTPKRANLQWADEKSLTKFIESKKLSKYFYETALKSPAQVRKALSKKFSDKEVEKFLSKQTKAVSSGYNLTNTESGVLDNDDFRTKD